MTAAAILLRQAGRRVLDALLPPRCLGCGTIVDAPGTLCMACWNKAQFIAAPHCDRCGLPFELAEDAVGPVVTCAACIADPPRFDRARFLKACGVAQ